MSTPPSNKCQLLDHFAIGVQSFMALIAFSSLLYKRHREHPRRPFMIWLLDVSKQALGGLLVHSCNVVFSLLAVSESAYQNPCIYYFLNILLDTTLGVLILMAWLRVYHYLYHECFHETILMGYYGDPPQWKTWLVQTCLFSCSLFSMKLCVVVLLEILPGLETLGKWVLSPFHQPQIEVLFVMLLFPLIMNVLQFWLIDQVIKYPLHSEYSSIQTSGITYPSPTRPTQRHPPPLFSSTDGLVSPYRRPDPITDHDAHIIDSIPTNPSSSSVSNSSTHRPEGPSFSATVSSKLSSSSSVVAGESSSISTLIPPTSSLHQPLTKRPLSPSVPLTADFKTPMSSSPNLDASDQVLEN